MEYGIFSALNILIYGRCFSIAQLLFKLLSVEVFAKLTLTAGILVVIIVITTLVIREYFSEKKLKKYGFID
ncbi:hypothetical protein ACK2M2_08225 [Acinetobacter sp. TY1]|mgnify:CR=1|uniref:hypothetical protein n=1 Tax=unclassified Acinetobacter TaxID=196816 RepID=UPI003050F130